eukprot:SAG31_NODE_10704_length_1108_cov_1.156591_1_plen_140_part_00
MMSWTLPTSCDDQSSDLMGKKRRWGAAPFAHRACQTLVRSPERTRRWSSSWAVGQSTSKPRRASAEAPAAAAAVGVGLAGANSRPRISAIHRPGVPPPRRNCGHWMGPPPALLQVPERAAAYMYRRCRWVNWRVVQILN